MQANIYHLYFCDPKIWYLCTGHVCRRQIPTLTSRIYMYLFTYTTTQCVYRSIAHWILSELRFTVVAPTTSISSKYFSLTENRKYYVFVCHDSCTLSPNHINEHNILSQPFAFVAEYMCYGKHKHSYVRSVCVRNECGASRKQKNKKHVSPVCSSNVIRRRVFSSRHRNIHMKYFHHTAALWVCFSDSNHNVFSKLSVHGEHIKSSTRMRCEPCSRLLDCAIAITHHTLLNFHVWITISASGERDSKGKSHEKKI